MRGDAWGDIGGKHPELVADAGEAVDGRIAGAELWDLMYSGGLRVSIHQQAGAAQRAGITGPEEAMGAGPESAGGPSALQEGSPVELRGFGSFRIRERQPRVGRNPKTGQSVQVPAKRIPTFRPGKELGSILNP